MKRAVHAERVDEPAAGRIADERKAAGALGRDISLDIEVQIVEGRLSPGDKLTRLPLGSATVFHARPSGRLCARWRLRDLSNFNRASAQS